MVVAPHVLASALEWRGLLQPPAFAGADTCHPPDRSTVTWLQGRASAGRVQGWISRSAGGSREPAASGHPGSFPDLALPVWQRQQSHTLVAQAGLWICLQRVEPGFWQCWPPGGFTGAECGQAF